MKIYHQSVFDRWPIEDKSVQSIITSPPYYQVRKYPVPDVVIGGDRGCKHVFGSGVCGCGAFFGQYGLEPVPYGAVYGYIEHTMLWLAEAWRVLRDDGCIFIVIDDKFAGSNMGRGCKYQGIGKNQAYYDYSGVHASMPKDTTYGAKKKSLLLIPERLMIAMQEAGWVIRNKIIWIRTMPSAVRDRFTDLHETIIFATKNPKYYFDLDAVREKVKQNTIERYRNAFESKKTEEYGRMGASMSLKSQLRTAEKYRQVYGDKDEDNKDTPVLFECDEADKVADEVVDEGARDCKKTTKIRSEDAETMGSQRARYHRKTAKPPEETGMSGGGHYTYGEISSPDSSYRKRINSLKEEDAKEIKKNPGDVWLDLYIDTHRQLINELGVEEYLDALREDILRRSDIFPHFIEGLNEPHYAPFSQKLVQRLILCSSRPGDIVVDPFVGSGTTLRVAERLNRVGIGIDLGYEDIQKRRLSVIQKVIF